MKCREFLLKAREDRKRELEDDESFLKKSIDFTGKDTSVEIQKEVIHQSQSHEVKSTGVNKFTGISLGSLQEQIEKRRPLLALEFPFLTDTISLNRMLVESFPKEMLKDFNSPVEWTSQHFRTKCPYDDMMRRKHILDFFSNIWPVVVDNFEFDGKEIHIKSKVKANIEDFVLDKPMQDLLYMIDQCQTAETTKKSDKSRARKMVEYCLHKKTDVHSLLKVGHVNKALEAKLNSKTLASYFEYLEERCFKKGSVEAYKDLIAVRLLFYAPSTLKKLNQICRKHIDQESLTIKFENTIFPVPKTFIELANAIYSKNEPFLQRNSKKLGTFIKQTSEANKMKRITPTAIRQSLQLICHQDGFIAERLPRR